MKIIAAPNAFKGSLTAAQAADAIAEGIAAVYPNAQVVKLPVADGGDGTAEVLVSVTGGHYIAVHDVCDPLGVARESRFGVLGDGVTAVVEMADASGLRLIPRESLNPMIATSYGTGQLIRACLDHGYRRIIVGLGGSATVEGGAGAMQALGADLLDAHGQFISGGGSGLATLAQLDLSKIDPRLATAQIIIACDVENPLLGELGAAAIFGPQKGATPPMVAQLEGALHGFATLIEQATGQSVMAMPRGGAAGGVSAALYALCGARLEAGAEIVLQTINFANQVQGAALVITGEGRIDAQTIYGKAPFAVAQAAQRLGVPTLMLAGAVDDEDVLNAHGVRALMPIVKRPMSLEAAMQDAYPLLREATSRALRLIGVWKA